MAVLRCTCFVNIYFLRERMCFEGKKINEGEENKNRMGVGNKKDEKKKMALLFSFFQNGFLFFIIFSFFFNFFYLCKIWYSSFREKK